MSKSFHIYTIEELASNPDFRNWVLNPTSELNHFWQDFLQKNPQKEAVVEEAKNIIKATHFYFDQNKTDPQKIEAYFEELGKKIEGANPQSDHTPISQKAFLRKWMIAASLLLLMASIGGFWISTRNQLQTYSTAFGEWKTIQLPDSSVVRLNANSELITAQNWREGEDRKVWLKGEAFFEVEKKPITGSKFTVIANEVSMEVLGTSFNVNSRGEKVVVFLQEGKIKLEANDQETYMEPGDFISYSISDQKIIEKRKEVNDIHSSWKDGALILQSKSVKEIFDKMEEIFGVEFQVDDSSLLEPITTVRIPMDKLEIAIPILEKTLVTHIEQVGNTLKVKRIE